MRQTITTTILILLCPFVTFGQVQFIEQFNDSNFTSNPAWTGDTAFFQINADKKLQLQDTVAGSKTLASASPISQHAQWSFDAELQFNPSSSNYAEIYLAADSNQLHLAQQAVFVRLGGSTADAIALYKRHNGLNEKIAESSAAWLGKSINTVHLEIKYDSAYTWKLFADTSNTQNNLNQILSIKDSFIFASKYTGVRCIYSKTRADKFWFDNFNYTGFAFQDTIKPSIVRLETISNRYLHLCFSEPLKRSIAEQKGNYTINTLGHKVDDVEIDSLSNTCIYLEIDPFLVNKNNYNLSIKHIEDLAGNIMVDTTLSFWYAIPEHGDIVINEILADPSPVIGFPPNALPEYEYIELYNRSPYSWNTKGWTLEIGTRTPVVLDSAVIPANGFLVLTQTEALSSLPNTNTLAVDVSQTALTNAGTSIIIRDSKDETLDAVYYSSDWYKDETKSNGGWSIERIDPDFLCVDAQNWIASISTIGGTPGSANSLMGVVQDTTVPTALRVAINGDSSIQVLLSELPERQSLLNTSSYSIQPKLDIKNLHINDLITAIEIYFEAPLKEATAYTISFSGIAMDCAGNRLKFDTLSFGKAEPASTGELFINEILFNPHSGGVDYVELYNASQKIFDVSKLRLGSFFPGTSVLDEVVELTDESFLLLPGEYVCLSESPEAIFAYYNVHYPERLLLVKDLPTLPDDAGSLVLLNANLELIESLSYTQDLHSPTLQDFDGASLERVRYDSVSTAAAWYSATSLAGFGTPGYINSQSASTLLQKRKKHLQMAQLFSPNNDGYQDKLEIHYTFDQPNYVCSLYLFDKSGALQSTLWNSESLSSKGVFAWNGTADDGRQLKKDMYLLILEYFHANGDRGTEKHPVVLTY